MKKYKTGRCSFDVKAIIEEIEIQRETKSSVWINNKREAKECTWHIYHDTWQAAHDYLKQTANLKVEGARNRLDRAIKNLFDVSLMEPPDEP